MNGGVYRNTNQCPHCLALQIPTLVSKRKSARTASKVQQQSPAISDVTASKPITPIAKQAAPAVTVTKPAIKQATPAVVPAKSATKQATPVVAATKPATKQATPAVAATKPATKQATPAVVAPAKATKKQVTPVVAATKPAIKKTDIAAPKPSDPSLETTQRTSKQPLSAVAAARAKRAETQSNIKSNPTTRVSAGLKEKAPTQKTQTPAPALHRQSQTVGRTEVDRKEAFQKPTNSTQQKKPTSTTNPFLQTRQAKPQQQKQTQTQPLPKTPQNRASIALAAINKAVLVENERSQAIKSKNNH